MSGFQPFGGATKFFAAITMAAGLIIQGVLNLSGATITGDQIPTTNNTYNLGSPTSTWHETYTTGVNFTNSTGTNSTSTNFSVTGTFKSTGTATSTFAGAVSTTRVNAELAFCIGYNSGQCIDSPNTGQLRYTGSVRADGSFFPLSGISSLGGDITPASTGIRSVGTPALSMLNVVASGTVTGSTGGVFGGGSAGKAMCWKADGKTLGYCSSVVGAGGDCTCN